MEYNGYSEEVLEYCINHGHVMHFLGVIIEDDYMCEVLFCSECHPEHLENPNVQRRMFDECGKICHY